LSSGFDSLTAQGLEFLQRPLHGFLLVAAGPLPPQLRPGWFEATTDGKLQTFTGPGTLEGEAIAPPASLVVAAPAGDRERWISVAGLTAVESGGAHELCARIAVPARLGCAASGAVIDRSAVSRCRRWCRRRW
jgi:hypothetical protein